jgi:hypothetical protein
MTPIDYTIIASIKAAYARWEAAFAAHAPWEERVEIEAEVARLALHYLPMLVAALPDAAPSPDPRDEALACGHHHSLGVKNIESHVVFCELCEARDELRDALAMECDLGAKVRARDEALKLAREALIMIDQPERTMETAHDIAKDALAALDAIPGAKT